LLLRESLFCFQSAAAAAASPPLVLISFV
jgi:hypothetical protein